MNGESWKAVRQITKDLFVIIVMLGAYAVVLLWASALTKVTFRYVFMTP